MSVLCVCGQIFNPKTGFHIRDHEKSRWHQNYIKYGIIKPKQILNNKKKRINRRFSNWMSHFLSSSTLFSSF